MDTGYNVVAKQLIMLSLLDPSDGLKLTVQSIGLAQQLLLMCLLGLDRSYRFELSIGSISRAQNVLLCLFDLCGRLPSVGHGTVHVNIIFAGGSNQITCRCHTEIASYYMEG